MCFSKLFNREKTKPQIELLSMLTDQVQTEIDALGTKLLYPCLLDLGQPYYYTFAEDWAKVFDYIYFKFDMPSYLVARMDCEDFAILLKGLVSAFFGLNYFAVVFGNTPAGYHSWNLFRDNNGWLNFETQTGKAFPLNEKGYTPEYILL